MNECEICKTLNEGRIYKVNGAWVDLLIKKDRESGKVKIIGICDGRVEIDANYCPECGRKLGD